MNKDIKQLLGRIEAKTGRKAHARLRNSGHYEIRVEGILETFVTSATASDWRSHKNELARVVRAHSRAAPLPPKKRSGEVPPPPVTLTKEAPVSPSAKEESMSTTQAPPVSVWTQNALNVLGDIEPLAIERQKHEEAIRAIDEQMAELTRDLVGAVPGMRMDGISSTPTARTVHSPAQSGRDPRKVRARDKRGRNVLRSAKAGQLRDLARKLGRKHRIITPRMLMSAARAQKYEWNETGYNGAKYAIETMVPAEFAILEKGSAGNKTPTKYKWLGLN